MKIERVEVFGVAIPLVGEFTTAYRSKSIQKSAVVRITDSEGRIGLGNVDPVPGYSVESVEDTLEALRSRFGPLVLGMDAGNIHVLWHRMSVVSPDFLDAKAAIEMACVDLTARAMGVPVHAYLGGAVREQLHFNAWIGILPPDEAAKETVTWQRRGFRSAKVKVGGGIEADRDRIRAIREAVGPDFFLRIDANAGYDADTSIRLAQMVAPYDLQLFEQPVAAHDLEGMKRVRREAAGIPIMADESVLDHASLIRLIKAEAADIVKVKVMKQGGLCNTRQMIETAAAAGLRCVVGHGFGLGINTLAEIMLAATSSNVMDGLECVGPLKTSDDIVIDKLDLSSGFLTLPDGPGLGACLDEEKLQRYRMEVPA